MVHVDPSQYSVLETMIMPKKPGDNKAFGHHTLTAGRMHVFVDAGLSIGDGNAIAVFERTLSPFLAVTCVIPAPFGKKDRMNIWFS